VAAVWWRCAGDIAAGDRLADAITAACGARGQERDEAALRIEQVDLLEPGTSSQQIWPSQVIEDLYGPAARP
jgi:hypothetical protein